jgi:hypothetical protein
MPSIEALLDAGNRNDRGGDTCPTFKLFSLPKAKITLRWNCDTYAIFLALPRP